MYSRPWSPQPSATAIAPELRTQKRSPGVAHTEALAGNAADIGFSGRRAVERYVAENNVLTSFKPAPFVGHQDQLAAGQSFAESVIGVACEPDRKASGQECAKRLSSAAFRMDHKSVFLQSTAELFRDLRPEDRAESAVRGGDF